MPVLCVLIAMTSIQAGAALAAKLFPILGVTGTVALRLFFSSLVLSLIWRPWKQRLSYRQIKSVVAYGASLGLMNFIFYLAIDRIPLGIAVALEFVGPLSVAIYSSRRPLDYLWALLAALGIVLVLPISAQVESLDLLGIFLALLAGVFWGAYIIFGQKMGDTHGGMNVCLGMIVAALCITPIGLAVDGARMLNLSLMPYALALGIISSALPYSLEMIGLRKMPAKTFSIMMSLEPALGALSGFVFLQENLSVQQWIAILCVMTASAGSSFSSRHPEFNETTAA